MTHSPNHVSRRDFLGIAGLAAIAGGIACSGGLLGYLALDRLTRAGKQPTPSPTAPRPLTVKQIDRPPIVTRADWGARAPDHDAENEPGFYSLTNVEGWRDYEGDLRAIYRTVVVHHSVLVETDDPATMRAVQEQHMDLRKWADIAYHFGVGRSGVVFEGRDLMARGTHVEQFNTGSVGVVFFGDFQRELPSQPQLDQGRALINWLALRLELTHLAGHHDFNEFTDCPGAHMTPYLEMFAESAGLVPGTGGYQPPAEQLITPTPAPSA